VALGLTLCASPGGRYFPGHGIADQRIGRALHPHQGPRPVCAMGGLVWLTQMVGPWLTKQWAGIAVDLSSAFGIGVGALAFGLLFLFFGAAGLMSGILRVVWRFFCR